MLGVVRVGEDRMGGRPWVNGDRMGGCPRVGDDRMGGRSRDVANRAFNEVISAMMEMCE